ncbi:hypothetical protein ACFFRR_011513 [Megaselia abdita]
MSSDSGEIKDHHFLKQEVQNSPEPDPDSHSQQTCEYYQEDIKNSSLIYQISSAHDYLRRLEESCKEERNTQTEVEILRLRNEIRKLKLRLAQRKRLASENDAQRSHRLATLRVNQKKRLANETPEQRNKRLQAMREYAMKRTRLKSDGDSSTDPYISV